MDDITEKANIIINCTAWYGCSLISVNYTWKNLCETVGKGFGEDFVISGEKGNWSPVGESCAVALFNNQSDNPSTLCERK